MEDVIAGLVSCLKEINFMCALPESLQLIPPSQEMLKSCTSIRCPHTHPRHSLIGSHRFHSFPPALLYFFTISVYMKQQFLQG